MQLYPFSIQEHGQDIEFRLSKVYREIRKKLCAPDQIILHDQLSALLSTAPGNHDGSIAYLTGPQFALAKESVAWAARNRTGRSV